MSEKKYHKICPDCGVEMWCYPQTQRCEACAHKKELERKREARERANRDKAVYKSISDFAAINQAARDAGMSYGRYGAARGL